MNKTEFDFEPVLYSGETISEVNESLRLIQKKNGLTYGTDAYLLSAFVREKKLGVAADLGSGTGIISLLCARKNKFSHIHAIEVQESFGELISRNAEINNLSDKISVLCRDLRDITSVDIGYELDAVFSNPPYMRADSGKRNEKDEKYIARHEVLGGIDDFCAAAARLLKFGGVFYCVYRPDRLTDLIFSMRQNKLEPKRMVFVHATDKSEPSVVLIEAKKGGACGLIMLPPLILSKIDENGTTTMSERAEEIYSRCSFE